MRRLEKIGIDINNVRIDEMVQPRGFSTFGIAVPGLDDSEISLSPDPDVLECSDAGIEPVSDPFFSQNCPLPLVFNGRPFFPDEKNIRDFPFGKIGPVPKAGSIGFVNQRNEIFDIHNEKQFPHLSPMLFPVFEEFLAKPSSCVGVFRSFIEKFVSMVGIIAKWTGGRIPNSNMGKNLIMQGTIFTDDFHGIQARRTSWFFPGHRFAVWAKPGAEFRQVVLNGDIPIFCWMKGLFQRRASIFRWDEVSFYNSGISFQNSGRAS